MAIYDRPVRVLMRELIDELAPEPGRVFSKADALRWFRERYPKIKDGTVSAHLLRFSTNAPSRVYYSPREDENVLFQVGRGEFRLFDPGNDPPPIHSRKDVAVPSEEAEDEEDQDVVPTSGEFAYESDLRDFLAKNLSLIEPGLRLYEEEGITGVEFPAGRRFIDILAVDSEGRFVVIELKVSRGYDRVVGQLLRYMGWIRSHHAEPGQGVRGVIAARDITQDLLLACAGVPNVQLYEYELSVALRRVEEEVGKGD